MNRSCLFRGTLAILIAVTAFGHSLTLACAETELDKAYRILSNKSLVDLTHSFGPDTPVWSGFGQAKMTICQTRL